MRAFVFTDRSLSSQARRFVWLAIDTEKARNAAFRRKYPVPALPTYFILDPSDEHVAVRFVGGTSVSRLNKMLDDGRAAVVGGVASGSASPEADRALAEADRAYGAGNDSAAAVGYLAALGAAPEGWSSYERAVESALFALSQVDRNEDGATLAREAFPRVRRSTAAASIAGSGLDCALSLPADHPKRAELVKTLEADGREVANDLTLPIAGDDRSGLFITLLDARKDANDSTGAHAVAEQWATFLEGEAGRAKTADARAAYDPHRLSAYLELGEPERAVPMLEASERAMPRDYNPPQRLATAYKAMKHWEEALAASDRAMALGYGPRKLLLYTTRTDIYLGMGDTTSARVTLRNAIAFADSMPPGQRSERSIASLRKKLDGLH